MSGFIKYLLFVLLIYQHISPLYAQEDTQYTVFITGNTFGENADYKLLNQWNRQSGTVKDLAVLLAGNSVNSKTGQIPGELLTNNKHPLLIAPGKAEWANGSQEGKDFIKQINKSLTKTLDNPLYFTTAACPGPTEVMLSDYLVVILIDTWWWVHKYDRRFNKCGIENSGDVLIQIEDAIRRHYSGKHVVVAGYHSLKSYGNSSGYFSFKQWLTQSPYTFFRKFPGTRTDIQHPDFKDFRNGLLSILKKYPDILYVSADEANMQYFQQDSIHFIISGSWQKSEYVRKDLPEFGSEEKGFAKLDFTLDGVCELTFFNADKIVFNKVLYEKEKAEEPETIVQVKLPDSLVSIASEKYAIPESSYRWLGKNYRDIWATPVKAPVFNISTKKGGLKILKRGGGQQTYSLRLEDNDGKQYVLRSIDKYVEGAVPKELHNTFAVDLVQDQISASNPYAAPVVATLAEHAGIFHTNPEVVFVPDDPQFGIYRSDVAGKLFLFEERPEKNHKDAASFGYPDNIVSTTKVMEKTIESSNHIINESAVLRARLFDIVINDWDRHDDQWRWAGFEQNGKTVYKPIPRDRDQAFFVNEGILPWIASRKWLIPKIQGFTEYTKNMEGQSFNARYFDRTFLTQSSWADWLHQIDSLKTLLTPEKIELAMHAFPGEIYPLCGKQTAQILKTRLENLESMARKLYLSLAKEISITGTNESNYFEILALSDTLLQISVYDLENDGQKGRRFYHRTFFASETKKIHLYGMDGNDQFEIKGNYPLKINLKIIGGINKNEVISNEKLRYKNISIYNNEESKTSSDSNKERKTDYNLSALKYDREHFKYNVVYPGILSGYNPDDGIFIGGGPVFFKYSRYLQQQYEILGSYAFATNAFNLYFGTKYSFPLRNLEVNFSTKYSSPEYAGNYFGLGNETKWQVPHSEKYFYRLRMSQFHTEVNFEKWLNANKTIKAGPGLFFSLTDVEQTKGRFISQPDNGLTKNDLALHTYSAAYFNYEINTLSGMERKAEEEFAGSSSFPTRGFRTTARVEYFFGLNEQSDDFQKLSGDFITYLSFSQRPRVVYALRVGGEKLFGNFPFHEAATLGRTENLRGYRETRFYGDASFYLNAEVRFRMKQLNTYLFNGTVGMLLFNDTARVWLKNESSGKWHNGTGAGLWISPFDMAVISVSYAASADDKLLSFSVNYQF